MFPPQTAEAAASNKALYSLHFQTFPIHYLRLLSITLVRVLSTNLLLLRKNAWVYRKFLSGGLMCLELKREENTFRIFNEMRFLVLIKFLAFFVVLLRQQIAPPRRKISTISEACKSLPMRFSTTFGSHIHSTACRRYLMAELIVELFGKFRFKLRRHKASFVIRESLPSS